MSEVRAWLPDSALTGETLGAAVGSAVDGWAMAWLGRRSFWTTGLVSAGDAQPAEDLSTRRLHGAQLELRSSSQLADALVGQALDAGTTLPAGTEADRRLMALFGAEMLGDLIDRIEKTLDPDITSRPQPVGYATPGRESAIDITLTVDQHVDAVHLSLPVPLAITAYKRLTAGQARSPRPLVLPLSAVGPAPVRIAAILGSAKLTLDQLGSLAPGDVLILDRALDAGADLTVAGSVEPFATVPVAAADNCLTLTL